MEVDPPDNAQSLESLFMHLRLQFNSGLPSGDKVLKYVGIINDFTGYNEQEQATYFRVLEVNKSAVSNIVDIKMDLTSLIQKTAVGDIGTFDNDDGNATLVYLETANASDQSTDFTNSAGTIKLWKLDAVYTTRQIR